MHFHGGFNVLPSQNTLERQQYPFLAFHNILVNNIVDMNLQFTKIKIWEHLKLKEILEGTFFCILRMTGKFVSK